jgi:transcriptional regulator with XRE-family HTH domain
MAQHSWLQGLLNRTGIAQADLAGFLNVSRSTVNMACRNERMLPTAANVQLFRIEQAMETLPPGTGSPFTSYDSLIKYFRFQARKRRYEAAVMERYTEQYEQKTRQWEQRERFWRAAGALVPDDQEGKLQAEWLAIVQGLLKSPPRQTDKQYYRFKAQMPLLLQEAEAYEKRVEEWESQMPTTK